MVSAGKALALALFAVAAPAVHGGWLEETSQLHQAAWNGDMPKVVEELEGGADCNAKDSMQRTALHFACYKGRISTTPVEDRVVGEPDPGNHVTEEMVEYMLEKGCDVNVKDDDGSTPLMEAVPQGHTAIVELLLKAGADPDVENRHGDTPLSVAQHRKHEGVVNLLTKDEL